ncbi:MAG: hypothetical protein ACLVJH_12725 [Faecalibacterium prausnitzii]
MPKTLPERIFFTIVMAAIMVYGMIVYNVALNTNGVTNATFVMALHEMPIMVPVAFVLEFFVVEKLATRAGIPVYAPHRPPAVHHLRHLADDCVHHVPGDESGRNAAVQRARALGCGYILGAAICPWRCAGRCCTAARLPVPSSGWCSAVGKSRPCKAV